MSGDGLTLYARVGLPLWTVLERGVTILEGMDMPAEGCLPTALAAAGTVSSSLRGNLGTSQRPQQAPTRCRGEIQEWGESKINNQLIRIMSRALD